MLTLSLCDFSLELKQSLFDPRLINFWLRIQPQGIGLLKLELWPAAVFALNAGVQEAEIVRLGRVLHHLQGHPDHRQRVRRIPANEVKPIKESRLDGLNERDALVKFLDYPGRLRHEWSQAVLKRPA